LCPDYTQHSRISLPNFIKCDRSLITLCQKFSEFVFCGHTHSVVMYTDGVCEPLMFNDRGLFVVSVPLSWSRDSFVLPPPASVVDCSGGRHDNESRTVGGATGDLFSR